MARSLPLVALLLLTFCASAQAVPKRPSVPASWTKLHKLTKAKARRDLDRDGLGTWAEWRSQTDPRKADSDGDRRPDGREDRDRDGLANAFELSARTDPARADSDGDRRRDGREDADRDGLDNAAEARYGYAPRSRDSDGDGVRDGDENAGVVRTVAGPLVTIALARGGTLVAALGQETEVGCVTAAAADPAGDAETPVEEITGDDELVDEGDSEETADEEIVDDLEETVAAAAQLPDDEEAEEEEPLDPLDPLDGLEDECAGGLRSGTRVHSARVTPGPAGLVLTELELRPAPYGLIATIRSIGMRARSAIASGTLTTGPPSRSASRSLGSVIIFM